MLSSHHFHPLSFVTGFRLFAPQVFWEDVSLGIVPMVFIIESGILSKLERTIYNTLFRQVVG